MIAKETRAIMEVHVSMTLHPMLVNALMDLLVPTVKKVGYIIIPIISQI